MAAEKHTLGTMKGLLLRMVLSAAISVLTIGLIHTLLTESIRLRGIVNNILPSIHMVAQNNNLSGNPLSSNFSYRSSQTAILGNEKAIWKIENKEIGATKGGFIESKNTALLTVLNQPKFSIIDKAGNVIGDKGVDGAGLIGLRVDAGPGFKIKSMDLTLAHDAAKVLEMNVTSGNPDFTRWRWSFRPGDRIVIVIKKVSRITASGKEENFSIGTVILTIPHAKK